MNKKLKKLLEQRYGAANKRAKVEILNENSSIIKTRDEQGDSSKDRIQLRIKLNSDSPVYGKGDYAFKEQIADDAFDESLAEVRDGTRTIYSFADHKMDTENIIASSKSETTTITKEDNEIVMEFDVDESDPKSVKIYRLISEGAITGNSFIFRLIDVEYKELKNDPDGAKTLVIIKKGELLSIDPVVFPWYPQNTMEARDEFEDDQESEEKDIEEENKKREEIQMKELLLKRLNSLYASLKRELPADLDAKNDDELFELVEVAQRDSFEKLLSDKLTEKEAKEARESFEQTMNETRRMFEEKDNEERQALANKIKTLEGKLEAKDEAPTTAQVIRSFLDGTFVAKSAKANSNLDKETLDALAKAAEETRSQLSEADLLVIEKRDAANGVSGSGADTASQIIPLTTDSELIKDRPFHLPEAGGSVRRIAYAGENSTKVPINIIPSGAAVRVGQDDDSKEVSVNDVVAILEPKIFSEHFYWNPRMQVHSNTVSADTMNLINRHVAGLRKEFAASMLTHVAVTFASLKGNDKSASAYTGGITSDAIVTSTTAGALAIADFDALEDGLKETYGDIVNQTFRYFMNTTTWGAVKALARALSNDNRGFQVDEKAMTINGIKVITNNFYTENIAAGKRPIILYDTNDVRVYGGNVVVKDSDQVKFLSRKTTRQVTTYGEMKLFDPHYRTRALEIKATA